jgi:hypothetical protein
MQGKLKQFKVQKNSNGVIQDKIKRFKAIAASQGEANQAWEQIRKQI